MYVFLWQTRDGERKWEAVKENQINGFLEKLLTDGVPRATIMVAYSPILFHWVCKEYHNGLSDVFFQHINEEICGTEPVVNNHKPVDVPVDKPKPVTKFGWLAPDGRFFKCDYGGHSNLADKIVGEVQKITNPERHLEELGWAKVLSGGSFGKRYAIGMDYDKKLTDQQLKTLEAMGLEDVYVDSWFL